MNEQMNVCVTDAPSPWGAYGSGTPGQPADRFYHWTLLMLTPRLCAVMPHSQSQEPKHFIFLPPKISRDSPQFHSWLLEK